MSHGRTHARKGVLWVMGAAAAVLGAAGCATSTLASSDEVPGVELDGVGLENTGLPSCDGGVCYGGCSATGGNVNGAASALNGIGTFNCSTTGIHGGTVLCSAVPNNVGVLSCVADADCQPGAVSTKCAMAVGDTTKRCWGLLIPTAHGGLLPIGYSTTATLNYNAGSSTHLYSICPGMGPSCTPPNNYNCNVRHYGPVRCVGTNCPPSQL